MSSISHAPHLLWEDAGCREITISYIMFIRWRKHNTQRDLLKITMCFCVHKHTLIVNSTITIDYNKTLRIKNSEPLTICISHRTSLTHSFSVSGISNSCPKNPALHKKTEKKESWRPRISLNAVIYKPPKDCLEMLNSSIHQGFTELTHPSLCQPHMPATEIACF